MNSSRGRVLTPGDGELMAEPGLIFGRCGVGLELALFPVGVEIGLELVKHGGRLQRRQAHVPLQPIVQGSPRNIRGADVGGAGSTAAMKQPGLGVEPGAARFGAVPHLGAALGQAVEGTAVRRQSG
jgi:hypothetical protein